MRDIIYLYDDIKNISEYDNLTVQLIFSGYINRKDDYIDLNYQNTYIHKYNTSHYKNRKLYKSE